MDLISYWQKVCAPYLRARLGKSERGASLVEYALLVALIAIVAIAAISFLGGRASSALSHAASAIS